jgi:hypothetical protein
MLVQKYDFKKLKISANPPPLWILGQLAKKLFNIFQQNLRLMSFVISILESRLSLTKLQMMAEYFTLAIAAYTNTN